MPKVKIKRKSILLDMAPMCDMGFLLLNFFILTSNFIQKEVVQVTTPSSISEIKIPETNVMLILVSNDNKVFFGLDGQTKREEMLKEVGAKYNVQFSPWELKEFSVLPNFGVPIEAMKSYLAQKPEVRDSKEWTLGIPADSTNNQLKAWVVAARNANPEARIAIKADATCGYPIIKQVMTSLQELDENRYNLITSLEENPEKVKY
ncbi:MAG: biopolymer transporter ExbD [Prevotellaceae bacterium]|jgi:biopolymer transport protein ExbD|nr:biopolymer transporter ExbD [Prevotellaceae bacterium]